MIGTMCVSFRKKEAELFYQFLQTGTIITQSEENEPDPTLEGLVNKFTSIAPEGYKVTKVEFSLKRYDDGEKIR